MQAPSVVALFITYPDLVHSGGRHCRQLFDNRRSVSDAVDLTLGVDGEAIVAAYLTNQGRVKGYLPGGIA